MKKLFGKSRELEAEIGKYLDIVNKAILIFKRDVIRYINKNFTVFEKNLEEIQKVENRADDFQKDIKYKLYQYMLIPESRGDVLALLESIDNVVDLTKKVVIQLSIEKPEIPVSLESDFLELTDQSVETVDKLVKSMRAYFEEIALVNDYINKVHFYEHEADKTEERLKRKIFNLEGVNDLCHKIHLRDFSERIAQLSDQAEEISERLSVATIKRSI